MAGKRKLQLPSHSEMVAAIVRIAKSATPAEHRAGEEWYREAKDYAAALAAGTALTYQQGAAVLSAVSPRTKWHTNKKWARQLVDWHQRGAVGDPPKTNTKNNRAKAVRVLQGGAPREVLTGPKTRAFYENIIGNTDYVTVDVWAFYAATSIKLRANQAVPEWAYPLVAAAYYEAAGLLGMTPAAVQAVAWIVVRGAAD